MTEISFPNYSTHLDPSAPALSCGTIRRECESVAWYPEFVRSGLILTPDAYIRTVVLL